MKKRETWHIFFAADTANNILVRRWINNPVVTIASTTHGWSMLEKGNRYSSIEKKRIEENYPEMIKHYNVHMGGTDRQD